MATDIRCPRCNRKLAERTDTGSVHIRYKGLEARGICREITLTCPACGVTTLSVEQSSVVTQEAREAR